MNGLPPPSDAERELNDLRVRMYRRDPDIEADPTALARLAELENAHVADRARPDVELLTPAANAWATAAPASDASSTAEPASDARGTAPATADADRAAAAGAAMDHARTASSRRGFWRSLWRRATATRSRIWFLAASSVVVVIVIYAVTWLDGPTPDATLRPLDGDDDGQVVQLMLEDFGLEWNFSTLQEYEPYRGVEPWTVMHPDGQLCLLAVERARAEIFNAQCVPPGTELFVNLTTLSAPGVVFGAWPSFNDTNAEGLPDGSVIRFHLRDDAVDVFLYPASKAD